MRAIFEVVVSNRRLPMLGLLAAAVLAIAAWQGRPAMQRHRARVQGASTTSRAASHMAAGFHRDGAADCSACHVEIAPRSRLLHGPPVVPASLDACADERRPDPLR